jgi:hypothetical protein
MATEEAETAVAGAETTAMDSRVERAAKASGLSIQDR